MPEEAPVMRTTLPATSSLKREERAEMKNLKAYRGGRRKQREKKVKMGAARFKNLWIISMAAVDLIALYAQ